ncbi:MAG: proton-conducting transporter membrane subunit [Rickettsia endosymbiont of Ixodes persulcatus]|nr:proton-conducting transporter membrane subunit [Rickettsia endosymbiont of Ixodes persulcatus]
MTTVFSSLIGLFQQDIKKVIAYSTMSQLAQEFFKFRHQTICVEIITIINSQITKARDNNHIKYNLFNSFTTINMKWLHSIMFEKRKVKFISKLVGISEAIRLILVFLNLNIVSLNSFIFSCYTSLATEGLLNKPSSCYTQTTNILPYTSCCIAVAKHPEQGVVDNTITDAHADTDASSFHSKRESQLNTLSFNEWLAGFIDGDGYFLLTKKGYVSCEICMDARDKKALYLILHKYGGSIKSVSGAKAYKYKLRNRKGLLHLINDINGLIRNPIRLLQMNKLCNKYEILIKYPKALTYSNG